MPLRKIFRRNKPNTQPHDSEITQTPGMDQPGLQGIFTEFKNLAAINQKHINGITDLTKGGTGDVDYTCQYVILSSFSKLEPGHNHIAWLMSWPTYKG